MFTNCFSNQNPLFRNLFTVTEDKEKQQILTETLKLGMTI